jgi:hypothetical protein
MRKDVYRCIGLGSALGALLVIGLVQARSRRLVPIETMNTWAVDTNLALLKAPRDTSIVAHFCPRAPTRRIEALVIEAAALHRVSAELVRAMVEAESGFDTLAVSPAGAAGLMQLTPETARRLGVTDCFDARQNVFAGTRHLRELLDAYEGNVTLAVAAYNAGRSAVARYGGVPPYPETLDYVRRVTARAALRVTALEHDTLLQVTRVSEGPARPSAPVEGAVLPDASVALAPGAPTFSE